MIKKISLALLIFLGFSVSVGAQTTVSRVVFHNTATVKIKNGEVGRYHQAVQEARIFKLTRREPGNISYTAFQSTDNPHLVVFNEIWKSKEALDQHLSTPHMAQFFSALKFNPAVYDIRIDGTKVIFTPKRELEDYVIEELILDGFFATEL